MTAAEMKTIFVEAFDTQLASTKGNKLRSLLSQTELSDEILTQILAITEQAAKNAAMSIEWEMEAELETK